MSFHDRLSRTQQILLAILCFPLLPFYLCYLCFQDNEKQESKLPGQPNPYGQAVKTHNTNGQQPVYTSESDQEDHVIIEMHPKPELGKVSFKKGQASKRQRTPLSFGPDQEASVTIAMQPIVSTLQAGETTSIQKAECSSGIQSSQKQERERESDAQETQVFTNLMGQDNKGFEDQGEQRPTLSNGQDLYAYPWDKSSLKSMPIDLQQFQKLDAYASKVNIKSSVENLMSVLLHEAHSELEKVRAIWMWICHHIEYDVKGYHNKAERSCEPADVFQSGKSVCAGYAGLFEQMCSIAGIQCKNLSGYSKGYSYQPGKVLKETDHAWNAVYLDGRWHLLDSTWGSGIVDDTCTKFTYRYNEFYFLTHPALFINDHFPEDSNWQLLKETLTLQQFGNNLHIKSLFYSAGLVTAWPETSIIETENGKATVCIESRFPALFLFNLNKVKENGLMTLQRNQMKLDVYPQQTGTHSLQIFAKAPEEKQEEYHLVLEYLLKCNSVDRSMCLPKGLIQPVGPSWRTEQQGILKAMPPGPIIHTEEGRCTVTFTRTKDLDFFATLDSDNSSLPDVTRRRHIWKTCQGNQVELMIHLPHAGEFALHIWAKKTTEPGDNTCALSYLISCLNKNVKWPMFPQHYTNWEDGYELVAPLAGILPASRQVQFKLKLPGIAKASLECGATKPLTLNDNGFWEGTCNTSRGPNVVVMACKKDNMNMFWSLLEYKVESQ